MLSNFPLIDFFKKLSKKELEYQEEDLIHTLYDIFNGSPLRSWEVRTKDIDKQRVLFAQQTLEPVKITTDLNDVQLLKLHCDLFPDYDMTLTYHKDFDLFEVKKKRTTQYLFTYVGGLYTPIDSIF